MGYDRDRAMHEQECTEEMIRMRDPDKSVMRTLTAHPDPLFDVIKAAADHCLSIGAPGVGKVVRDVIACNIARRAAAELRK